MKFGTVSKVIQYSPTSLSLIENKKTKNKGIAKKKNAVV